MLLPHNAPLISVIIPTFNASGYLPKAIESVMNQTYTNFEVIIIDDGSTDNTRSIIKESEKVKYFYQENKGLSSARNAGMQKSNGKYLVFLDADDWLENEALMQNYLVIKDRSEIAFVSGNYYLLRAGCNDPEAISVTVNEDHYTRLLQCNYIGMHAAVLFQRWVFDEFRYDETLKACEDYDLYLVVTRKYPVIHHQEFIATYNFHPAGLSHNHQLMMDSINRVIQKQHPYLRSGEEESAYLEGLEQWKDYYELMKASA